MHFAYPLRNDPKTELHSNETAMDYASPTLVQFNTNVILCAVLNANVDAALKC